MKRTLFAKLSLLVTCSLLFTACSGASASGEEDSAPETETASSADTAVQTETEPAAQPADQNLLFEDDFDGTELDTSKWELCPEWKRQGELDIWEHDMTSLDGEGHLVLRAEWDDQKSRVKSGAIRTYELFTAGYGYYEASIKFPIAPGTWGAFWMMCGDVFSEENGAADGVEIDIIESIGNERGACNHALHWDGYGEAHRTENSGELFDYNIYDGQFHIFGLERTEEAYIFYIDDKESWRADADTCTPCPEEGYLKLTVEAADWAGAGSDACISGLPGEMLVDYVRVYSQKP